MHQRYFKLLVEKVRESPNPFYSQISAKHIEVSLFDSKLLSLD